METIDNQNLMNAFAQPGVVAPAMGPGGIVPAAPVVPTPVAPPTQWDKIKGMASAFGNRVTNALDPAQWDPKNARAAHVLAMAAGAVAPDTAQGRFGNMLAGLTRNAAVAPVNAGIAGGVAPVSNVRPTDNKLGIASSLTPDPMEGMTSFSVKPGTDGQPRYTITGTGDYSRVF